MFLQIRKFRCALLAVLVTFLGSPTPTFALWYPEHEFATDPTNFCSGIDIASDAHGNAMVIFTGDQATVSGHFVYASYYNGATGIWGAPQTLDTNSNLCIKLPVVAMDSSGTALAAWVEMDTGNILSAQFKNGIWSAPVIVANASTAFQFLSIAMNNQGKGVLVYNSNTLNQTFAILFDGTNWVDNTVIGTGIGNNFVAYSDNGDIVAGFLSFGAANVNNYVNGFWQGPVALGASPPDFTASMGVGIDSHGNALAIWEDTSTMFVFSNYFTKGFWQINPTIVSTGPVGNLTVDLSMSPNGTAIAAWVDNSNNAISSVFEGNTWMAPVLISPSAGYVSVSMNDYGNAFAVWLESTALILLSAELPFGGVWGDYETVSPLDSDANYDVSVITSYSNNGPFGTRFAVWDFEVGENFFNSSGAVSPGYPSGLTARVCKNKFAVQTERAKIITWTGAPDSGVVSYLLTRNGKLIATIPATGPFVYNDHGRCKKTDVYTLTALYFTGFESAPLEISVK
jgi:hypothetical protein